MTKPGVVRMLLLIVAAALVCFAAAIWSGNKPFNDSDLAPQTMQVPAGSNAFWTLLEATLDLYWPEAMAEELDGLSSGRSWDDSLANEVLEKNQACLTWFHQSFHQRWLVFPRSQAGLDESPAYLRGFKTIGHLECIQAARLFHDKKEKEAFDEALNMLEFGHRLEDAGGGRMDYLVGESIKWLGLRRIRQMRMISMASQCAICPAKSSSIPWGPTSKTPAANRDAEVI